MKWRVSLAGVWLRAVFPAWLLGCVAAQAEPPPATKKKDLTITVLATNDVHGRLSQLPLFGGYVANARAARAADGGGLLLLDAGDIFQGTLASNLTEGAAMLRAFRALGYAAAAVGNHEFDFGPVGPECTPVNPDDDPLGALRQRIAEAGFAMLSSNLRARDGSPCTALLPGLRPSILVEVAGVRIGVVGGVTEDALTATHAANVARLSIAPLAQSVAAEALQLRQQGAQIVIALVHAGGECTRVDDPNDTSSCDERAEVFMLARELAKPLPLVDLIIAGHTHAYVAHRVAGIPIIESLSNGQAFGRVDFTLRSGDVKQLSAKIFPPHKLCQDTLAQPVCAKDRYENAPVQRDARVLAAIEEDLTRAQHAADEKLGIEIVAPIERSSAVESPLSNLVADLMRKAVRGADAAFNNPGSIRIALPAGPLTYGRMFEMFPFENRLASIRMRVSDLAHVVQNSLQSDRGLVSLSGVRASARCRAGQLQVFLSDTAGTPLPPARKLHVITSDYVVAHGDELLNGVRLPKTSITFLPGPSMRDALITGFQKYAGGRIDGSDRRIFDPKRPRLRYPGPRPIRCDAAASAVAGPT